MWRVCVCVISFHFKVVLLWVASQHHSQTFNFIQTVMRACIHSNMYACVNSCVRRIIIAVVISSNSKTFHHRLPPP